MATPIYYFDFSKKAVDLLGLKDLTLITNEQAIRESVMNILSTEVGSRPMYPEYGVSLDRYMFEFIDDVTASTMSFDISRALEAFEPRINNVEVVVTPIEDDLTYTIDISYRVLYNNQQENVQVNFSKLR